MNITLITNTLHTVASVALIVLVGFIGVKAGILTKFTLKELSAYLLYVAVPCTIIAKLYVLESVNEAVIGVALSCVAQVIAVLIGYGLATLFKVPKEVIGVNAASFGICNSGFIGLPIVTMLFGGEARNIAIYFIVSNNVVFWTLGAYLIKKDGIARGKFDTVEMQLLSKRIKQVNPPIVIFFIMLIIVGLNIPLPRFFLSAVEILDETTAPAALVFCGTVLGRIGFKNIKWKKGFSLIMIGRYLVSPAIMAGIFLLFPQGDLFQKVLIIQAAMPVVTLVELGASKYGGDVEYASLSFIYSLIILAVTLPITYYILMA